MINMLRSHVVSVRYLQLLVLFASRNAVADSSQKCRSKPNGMRQISIEEAKATSKKYWKQQKCKKTYA